MFEILAKFFKFSGKENENKFKLSIVIGLVEALASAMKIPAIMYVLIGLMSKESMGNISLVQLLLWELPLQSILSARDFQPCSRQKAGIMQVLL